MYLVLILIAVVWIAKRNAPYSVSQGALSGGWHPTVQSTGLSASDLPGGAWNNGTVQPIFDPQWSGYDAPINGGAIVFAVEGGQDGQNPSIPSIYASRAIVTTLPRFRMLGGGDPQNLPNVPIQISTLNDRVRR